MSLLIATTLKVSCVLVLALVAAALLRRQSAALRHWILVAGIAGAALVPVLRPIAPSWDVPLTLTAVQRPIASPPAAVGSIRAIAAPLAPDQSAPRAPLDVYRLLAIVWAGGAALGLFVLAAGFARLSWLAARADRLVDGPAIGITQELTHALRLTRTVALLESDHPSLPVTWGFRRPSILLPRAAREWSGERLRVVLLHELTHVQRGDWLTQLAAECVRAVYWFNPLAWLASRRLRQESELACDDAVLSGGMDGAEYAAHLLALARSAAARSAAFGTFPAPAMARPSSLERRFRAMLNVGLNRRPVTRPRRVATTAIVFLFTVLVAGFGLAQTFSTFSGSVVDATNRVLPGVTLTLVNVLSQAKYEIKSDSAGRFEFVGLPPGDYAWASQLNGFATLKGTIAVAGRDVQQDLSLRVGSLSETITIKGGVSAAPARRANAGDPATPPQPKPCAAGPVGGTIKPPMKIRSVDPQYPADLNAAKIGGVVILDVIVDVNGDVRDVTVLRSPNPGLELAATEAVRQWKYTPTLLNCVPVEVRVNVAAGFVAGP